LNIRYIITLTNDERKQLQQLTRGGKTGARKVKRAQILLAAERGFKDAEIAAMCASSTSTVFRTKRRFVEEGLDAALSEQTRRGATRLLDAKAEATLTAIACTDPPPGRSRWTLQLLANRLVCLTDLESVSTSTICRRLKDSDLKPWQEKMWCIPELNAEFVARMEDILDLYAKRSSRKRPVVCFDEKPIQLISEVRTPLPPEPGKPRRYDSEYRREGTANLFVFLNANEPWRHVKPTKHRKNADFSHCMRDLVDEHFPNAEMIHVVLDNLSTHKPAALYETFPAEEARRILRRLHFHYTPKHGSWLNMVEIENGVIQTQCLDRRIPDFQTLCDELRAWENERNDSGARVRWRFTVEKARNKMSGAYPNRS
jgi:transposase